jgi:putative transcriptional regulator
MELDIKFTLEQARKHRGLTQEQIAKMLGMTKRTYIDYEQYKRAFRIDKAFLFAEIVGIPINNIIFFDPQLYLKCRKEVG